MNIQTIPIKKINPAAHNPRKDLQPGDAEYEKLKKSITEFDIVEPLVWNKRSGNLVGGHQRLKVLKEMGHKEVEVSVVDLTDAKEKALNLALNKISGEWDLPLLKDLLLELDTGEFDMEITGFDDKEIEDLMTQLHEPEEGLTDDDEIPEQVETVCKKGDLWILGDHRLLCGDATIITDVERLMGGEKFNICFTSPPYGNLRDYHIGDFDWDELMLGMWDCLLGQCQPDAHILVNLGIIYKDRKVNLYWQKWLDHVEQSGFPLFGWYVWDKGFGMCGDANGRLAPSHEFIFHFNKESSQANKWLKTKTKRKLHHTFRQKDGTLKEATSPDKIGQPFKIPDSVVRINKETNNKTDHPAPYPVAFAEFGLSTWSSNKDICYEPFSGSGTNIIACEKLNRRCFAIDIDPHYVDIAIQRWENFTGRKAELSKV